MPITVLNLRSAIARAFEFDAILTIEDRKPPAHPLRAVGRQQLVLSFEDLDEPGEGAVSPGDVESALAFARRFEQSNLLIHCIKGQARSPAIALAILAERLGPGQEDAAVQALLEIRPDLPDDLLGANLEVVRVADELLGRQGRLVEAWATYEATHLTEAKERYRFWRIEAAKMDAEEGVVLETDARMEP